MALYKIDDYYPTYQDELFDGEDIKGLGVYSENDEKVGTVHTALVDEDGRFRYLVLDIGFWIFGKKVLLPAGRFQSDPRSKRIYLRGLTKRQAEDLPEYDESMTVDYDYEERVRTVYRTIPLEQSAPLESSAPLNANPLDVVTPPPARQPAPPERTVQQSRPVAPPPPPPVAPPPVVVHEPVGRDTTPPVPPAPARMQEPAVPNATAQVRSDRPAYDRSAYHYDQEPSLYAMNDQDHQAFRLYEERLVAHKNRRKVGEVTVSKRIETEMKQITVPVQKERIVIEHNPAVDQGQSVAPNSTDFQSEEVMRVDLYEETVDIEKQPTVREEVIVRKEVERETLNAEETLRHEELDINTTNHPSVEVRPHD